MDRFFKYSIRLMIWLLTVVAYWSMVKSFPDPQRTASAIVAIIALCDIGCGLAMRVEAETIKPRKDSE